MSTIDLQNHYELMSNKLDMQSNSSFISMLWYFAVFNIKNYTLNHLVCRLLLKKLVKENVCVQVTSDNVSLLKQVFIRSIDLKWLDT